MRPSVVDRLRLGIVTGIVLCFGCGAGTSSSSRASDPGEAAFDPAAVKPVRIEIDENRPGAEVSLTRNFYFLFDGSGSMGDGLEGCAGEKRSDFRTKLAGAKWALRQFIDKVPGDVNLGLYVFDGRGRREVVPLGPGKHDEFVAAVKKIKHGGGTPLAEAIKFGTDRLVEQYKRQLGYGEYRLIVVTDGLARKIPENARYAIARGIPIYTIGLCIKSEHPLRRYSVSYRAADSFQDLERGLEETLAELASFDATEFE